MMSLELTLSFVLAMGILAASPGPGTMAVVGRALSGGFRPALFVTAGIVLGDLIFLTLAVFGLAALAQTLGELFLLVKFAGAGYLIWLGCKLILSDPQPMTVTAAANGRNGRDFATGLFITLGNPKAILFYIGFLPTFVDLTRLTAGDFATIALIVSVVLAAVMTLYAAFADRARRMFTSRKAARNLNRGAGAVMIGAGAVIATR